jgi:hypothetical protein
MLNIKYILYVTNNNTARWLLANYRRKYSSDALLSKFIITVFFTVLTARKLRKYLWYEYIVFDM